MEKFGTLILHNKFFELYDDNSSFWMKNKDTNELEPALLEDILYFLFNPWNHVKYDEDEECKCHWRSFVYDGISIDIWSNSPEGLLNLITDLVFEYCETNHLR